MANEELERRYGKAYINEDLLDKVLKARQESEVLNDDSFKVWEKELTPGEKRYYSELGRSLEQFSKDEFAVVVYVAILNYPEMVFQLLMEEYLINKESRNDSNKGSR